MFLALPVGHATGTCSERHAATDPSDAANPHRPCASRRPKLCTLEEPPRVVWRMPLVLLGLAHDTFGRAACPNSPPPAPLGRGWRWSNCTRRGNLSKLMETKRRPSFLLTTAPGPTSQQRSQLGRNAHRREHCRSDASGCPGQATTIPCPCTPYSMLPPCSGRKVGAWPSSSCSRSQRGPMIPPTNAPCRRTWWQTAPDGCLVHTHGHQARFEGPYCVLSCTSDAGAWKVAPQYHLKTAIGPSLVAGRLNCVDRNGRYSCTIAINVMQSLCNGTMPGQRSSLASPRSSRVLYGRQVDPTAGSWRTF